MAELTRAGVTEITLGDVRLSLNAPPPAKPTAAMSPLPDDQVEMMSA